MITNLRGFLYYLHCSNLVEYYRYYCSRDRNLKVCNSDLTTELNLYSLGLHSYVYTNSPSVHCIWPSMGGATVTLARDIRFLQSICDCTQFVVLLYAIFVFKKWKDMNPRPRNTAVLLRGHRSNGVVESVYSLFCVFVYLFFTLGPYSEGNLSIPLFSHMAQHNVQSLCTV